MESKAHTERFECTKQLIFAALEASSGQIFVTLRNV